LLVQPAAQPVPLVQPVAQPVLLVQPAAQPVLLVPAPSSTSHAHLEEGRVSVIPDTAPKVPTGPNGLPRVEVELDVHSDSNFYTNFLGDIRDRGGIFVATFGALSVGTQCEVVIAFPGDLRAEVRGVVRWKRETNSENNQTPGLGVEIVNAAPDAWRLIERFIKNRDPIVHDV
jgi:Tfp pilus assembly protein PilZ